MKTKDKNRKTRDASNDLETSKTFSSTQRVRAHRKKIKLRIEGLCLGAGKSISLRSDVNIVQTQRNIKKLPIHSKLLKKTRQLVC